MVKHSLSRVGCRIPLKQQGALGREIVVDVIEQQERRHPGKCLELEHQLAGDIRLPRPATQRTALGFKAVHVSFKLVGIGPPRGVFEFARMGMAGIFRSILISFSVPRCSHFQWLLRRSMVPAVEPIRMVCLQVFRPARRSSLEVDRAYIQHRGTRIDETGPPPGR